MSKEKDETAQDRGIIFNGTVGDLEKDLSGIHVLGKGWKKLGFKGRVEIWDKNGKLISAHKTVRDAVDSIKPFPFPHIKEAKNGNKKKKGRGHKIPD